MPVEDTPSHPLTVRSEYRAGCHSRPPPNKGYYAQDGWNADGTRRMIVVQHAMSTKCRQILPLPECRGCTAEKDYDYINKMKEMK